VEGRYDQAMTQENPPLTSALDAIKAAVGPQGWLEAADDVAPYVLDWRRKWPGASPLVVRPACTQELAEVMRLCAAHQISVVPQSGNTGLVGGSGPRANGRDIVLSLNRMAAIREVDPVNNTMTVEAGCILADIQAAADGHDRIYPLSLAAEGSCRIGGNLSTNAGGTNVLRYGNARDHVLGLEVVLADGRIWDGLRGLRKDNTGYDLKQLFLGSEGTLGIITAAVLKLWPKPRQTVTSWLGVPNAHAAVAILNKAQAASGSQITGFEYIVRDALELTLANMPQNRNPLTGTHAACVLMEATSGQDGDGLRNTVEAILADAMEEGLIEDAVIAESDGQAKALWQIREDIPEAQIHAGGGLKHDVAVPVSKVADFLDEATALVHKIAPMARVIAFGHLGDGNIHFNQSAVTLDRQDELLALERDVNDAVESLAVTMGGSFSAEHGVGRLRLRQMSLYKSEVERDLMASIKQTLDPAGLLNPGKVVAFERDAG
jgi:FAD/FMN-containing dehydrogenase